ncbi:MAG: hypothetical protein A2Z96_00625 [Spirochaetes bacterium GWB1_48_6]|nr:MAG: hypothetical protein A2Z96_00625 [Spirochaetes bacterium GWB1_48_6]
METHISQTNNKTRTGVLVSLGFLVLTSAALPIMVPQARYMGLDLEIPEDLSRSVLLSTMGHWEESLPHSQEEKVSDGKIPSLVAPLTLSKYKVKSGEAVSTIANKFGLTLGTVISFNQIRNVKRVQVGMELSIPNQDGLMYTVARGDSLGLISRRTGITYESILDANNMESPVIQPGQKLFLPGAAISRMEIRQALGEMFIMPARGRFTSGYGYRKDPFTGVRRFHNGIDIANVAGTPIKAAMEGRVSDVGYHSSYGNYVVISHDGGYQTMYAHLSAYKVAKGQRIAQGETIAQMGNTGYSTGTHLHFSVFRRNVPTDPTKLLY